MIGATVPTIGGLHNAFAYGDEWNCDCIQIYLTSSRTWKFTPIEGEQKALYYELWKASRVKEVISHVPFLVNLASPDDELKKKSLDRLRIEAEVAIELDVNLLVLHPGSSRGSDKQLALQNVIAAINIVHEQVGQRSPVILVETMAGQGNVLGSTFEELAQIIDGVVNKEKIGVCFDMAHVFAAGYDISSADKFENVLAEFDAVVGLNKIGLFHINDSKTGLGSHHDRHTYVGGGEIGMEPFRQLLNDSRLAGIPKILELPNHQDIIKDNLEALRALIV